MGPPPKYIIQRRLVKKFVANYLPKKPLLPSEYFTSMFQCWSKFGAGSPKCKDEQLKYDFAQNQSRTYRQKLEKKGFGKMVTQTLKKPAYDFNVRGRHRKTLIESIFKMM